MNAIWTILTDIRVLSLIGVAALAAFLFVGASTLQIAAVYAAIALGVALFIWGMVWLVRKILANRAAKRLEQALDENNQELSKTAPKQDKQEVEALRGRLQEAVKTIKTSKLGELTGSAALYELPWYIVIGNPAAGKSTAVVKSGLKFPFAKSTDNIIQGIGGTRNCDWFFTSEGILLDTAGRYSVHEEDRSEWMGFLSLLKKHRAKAPINGIMIAVSMAELAQSKPEAAIELAKNLRQRVQELTEKLEVFAPVYLVFTKTDLISGFTEFFEDQDRGEREKVWGATLPYQTTNPIDAVGQFQHHFDELCDGLKQLAVARMSLHRGEKLPPGVLTFPVEFRGLKPALSTFIATLFEENPYQFRPVFRGFYFTSALQQGSATSKATDEVAQQFSLKPTGTFTTAQVVAEHGFFLKDLFSKVIFADRNLVRQYASRQKLQARAFTFGAAVIGLALALGGWTWSYLGNRQLMSNVQADLVKVAKIQADRVDLASRLEALEVLQDRIEQLRAWRESRPVSVGLGLYQGEAIERKLRQEYFNGVRQVMLQPVGQTLEAFLSEVNAHADKLQPMTRTPVSAATPLGEANAAKGPDRFAQASPERVEDAYNALKTYLMLSDKSHMEAGHLTDQLTRFWRVWLDDNRGTMPREQMIRSAERMISYVTANLQDEALAPLPVNLGLVDQARENLRRVVRGMPAKERVYAEVKARAATRFPTMTVARIVGPQGKDTVAGSYAISGTFTREAWDGYIEEAFKNAASNELQSVDWVLKTSSRDDLSLEGSPEQIRKTLTDLYKAEYTKEWQRFMQGITIAEFGSFEGAVKHMNALGDANTSPVKKVMSTLYDQTSWDNPSLINDRLGKAQSGFLDWFKQTIMRQAPSQANVNLRISSDALEVPMGPIGKEFAALSRIMMSRDDSPTLMTGYLQQLAKIRTKFNQMKTQGDPGPASRQMMGATLEAGQSELAEALKFVDEQMLVGMSDSARASLRPLLVRPLMQSFAVIVVPSETEINRVWAAQVYEPFTRTLAGKYPFDSNSRIEAAPDEIAKVFGPAGTIAKFSTEALATLVVRRGDTISARTWADMGLRLRPEFSGGLASWVAPLEGAAAGGSTNNGGGAAAPSQTVFQILPQGAPGLTEYTVEIDGQSMRYRNMTPAWVNFVWPNPSGSPGVRITGVTVDGRTVELLNEPGRFGLTRMFELAQRQKKGDINVLTWSKNNQSVTVQLRLISQPGAPSTSTTTASGSNNNGAGGGGSGLAGLRNVRLPTLVVGSDQPAGVVTALPDGGTSNTAPTAAGASAPASSAATAATTAMGMTATAGAQR
jgi:type VI secretion system protein ImpL